MPEEEQKILRVEIDGTWTLDEFSDSLRSIGDIYGLRTLLAIEQQSLEESEGLPFPLRRLSPRLRAAYAHGIIFPEFPLLINPSNPTEALRFLEPDEQLYVERIQFASPGFTDLAGLGTIVGHVKDFLLRLIELGTTGKQRRLENEQREETVKKMRIENARALVGLFKEMGYSSVKLRKLVHWVDAKQANLIPLVEEGKIRGVQVLSKNEIEKP